MKIANNVTELIGNTPLVRLGKIGAGMAGEIIAKLESVNPLSSIKDRTAYGMIRDAEERGVLKDGGVIIEATSGNTGIGLALICAVRGYRLIVTMPETMSRERKQLLQLLGAELILTPGALGMPGAVKKAEEKAAGIPGAVVLHQFSNKANPEIHRQTTGPEIWRDTDGRADILISGVGTGGTITGIAEFIKNKKPGFRVIAVEPAGSAVLSGGKNGAHRIEGIGAGFVPEVLRTDLIDEIIKVRDKDAVAMVKRLAREEGILAGISSGAAVWAAVQVAGKEDNKGKMIIVILPDGGERYLSGGLLTEQA